MSGLKVSTAMEVETGPIAESSKSSVDTVSDRITKDVMAAGAVGSITCSLHPLVIMNVSEHWTREKAQEGSVQQVIGALIGKQKGRNIEIMNSFELVFSVIGGDIAIDRDYYNMKEEQFKQVFSDMDFIGWYTTGDAPGVMDIKVHKQICEINESPIMLKLNPYDKNIEHLPVNLYESVIDLVNGEATMLFVPLTYTLATEEAERIGVDHVARMSSNDAGESSLVAEHLTAQHSAIKMLYSRVRLVLEYMKAVQSGQLPRNHEILREAYSLCHRLPVVDSVRFRQDFYNPHSKSSRERTKIFGEEEENWLLKEDNDSKYRSRICTTWKVENGTITMDWPSNFPNPIETVWGLMKNRLKQCNDVGLMTYLGTLTKGCNDLNQFVNKFNILYDRQGMGRRMRGIFF